MTIQNVLLLGGSGFVGGYIANLLSEQGIKITIPTRRRERTKALITLPTVDMVEANINDEDTLVRLMAGQDAVINLVGVLHTTDCSLTYGPTFAKPHVELPKKIVAAMRRAGVKRLLHMSALKADSKGPSEYLRSKGDGETAVLAAKDLDVTVFRPSVMFGVGDSFLTMFAKLQKLAPVVPLGMPNARFQPVYVNDVAAAFVNSLGDSSTYGQAYDLCGPKTYTLRQLVEYAGQVSGNPRRIRELGEGWAYFQAGLLMLAPKPLLSPDNLRSMQVDSVCDGNCLSPKGWSPAALEAVAPTYLSPASPRGRYYGFRSHAGR